MNINDLWRKYNFEISDDNYFLDFFSKIDGVLSYIDWLPFCLDEKEYLRFNQIETQYAEVLGDEKKRNEYMCVENKYISLFKKFWIYSDMYVKVDSLLIPKWKIRKYLDPEQRFCKSLIENSIESDEMLTIDTPNKLLAFVTLSCRNAISAIFWLKHFNIVVVPMWSSFIVCNLNVGDDNGKFKEIVNSENLFLRGSKK